MIFIVFTETKTDDTDEDMVADAFRNIDFIIKLMNRFHVAHRRSGGIAVAIKTFLSEKVTFHSVIAKHATGSR